MLSIHSLFGLRSNPERFLMHQCCPPCSLAAWADTRIYYLTRGERHQTTEPPRNGSVQHIDHFSRAGTRAVGKEENSQKAIHLVISQRLFRGTTQRNGLISQIDELTN